MAFNPAFLALMPYSVVLNSFSTYSSAGYGTPTYSGTATTVRARVVAKQAKVLQRDGSEIAGDENDRQAARSYFSTPRLFRLPVVSSFFVQKEWQTVAGLDIDATTVSFEQRYNKPENILVFRVGAEVRPVKPIQAGVFVRYDAKGAGLRQMGAHMQYSSQCWGVRIEAAKEPNDFSVQVKFDLFGITVKRPKDL